MSQVRILSARQRKPYSRLGCRASSFFICRPLVNRSLRILVCRRGGQKWAWEERSLATLSVMEFIVREYRPADTAATMRVFRRAVVGSASCDYYAVQTRAWRAIPVRPPSGTHVGWRRIRGSPCRSKTPSRSSRDGTSIGGGSPLHAAHNLLALAHDHPRVLDELTAGLGRRDAAARPLEQHQPVFFLEGVDLFGHRRRGHVQQTPCLGEAAGARGGDHRIHVNGPLPRTRLPAPSTSSRGQPDVPPTEEYRIQRTSPSPFEIPDTDDRIESI